MAQILMMEDDIEFAYRLQSLLETEGHDVTWSRSASEAMDTAAAMHFDLIITDLIVLQGGRPVSDGGIRLIGSLRMTKSRPDGTSRRTPIIAMSAAGQTLGSDHLLNVAESVGADYSIAKPFGDEEFIDIVEDALAKGRYQGN